MNNFTKKTVKERWISNGELNAGLDKLEQMTFRNPWTEAFSCAIEIDPFSLIRTIRDKAMIRMEKRAVFTTSEAIKYLRISKPTYLKYLREGRIKAVKAGKGWKVLKLELDRFLTGGIRKIAVKR